MEMFPLEHEMQFERTPEKDKSKGLHVATSTPAQQRFKVNLLEKGKIGISQRA
jgi:hypothetical protein